MNDKELNISSDEDFVIEEIDAPCAMLQGPDYQ